MVSMTICLAGTDYVAFSAAFLPFLLGAVFRDHFRRE
jgi:hypothetical protein